MNDVVNNSSSNKTYLTNIYNILFYDSKTQVDFRNLFYAKIFEVNTKQNDFIEINLKMLLEYENISEKIMLILFMKFLMKIIIVAKYWVFIYEPHYDHNDLFFWISSLRTQSKNYINIWN